MSEQNNTWRFEFLRKARNAICVGCRRFARRYRVPGNPQKVKILPLTPVCDATEISIYANRLRLAMDDSRICNIAVTGRFGAGKSSFLRTYFRDAKVLWISLAPFINTLPNLEGKGYFRNREQLGQKLEASVLQQMFYTARSDELPFSRFARIGINNWWTYLLVSVVIVLSSVSFVFISQPEVVWRNVRCLLGKSDQDLFLLGVLLSLVPLAFIVAYFCDLIRKARLGAKINAICAEIEMGKSRFDLAFNRALDEVIYHFQRIKYEAVVFEDLDRFPDTFIFAKLKEVNQLVNSSRDVSWSHKPIKFIFAVKDTILGDVERVKFFDYILPIVPSMTASNSKELFFKCLKEILDSRTLADDIKGLVRTVSPYIYDRRLLHNICNEFSVYKERLGSEIPVVNLLAFMLYKNVLPEDFEALQEGHGIFFELMKNKEALAEKDIRANKEKIKELEAEFDANVISGPGELLESLEREMSEYVEQNREIAARTLSEWFALGKLRISNIYELMGISKTEQEERNNSKNKLGRMDENHKEVNWYQRNRASLLFSLISGGWLSEQFKYYIVSYSDEIISDNDHNYILQCLRGVRPDESYGIENIKEVINELPLRVFSSRSVLNYSLVKEFLTNDKVPVDKKSLLFVNLFSSEHPKVEFMERFLNRITVDSCVEKCFAVAVKPNLSEYMNYLVENMDVSDAGKLQQLGILFRIGAWKPRPYLNTKVLSFLANHQKVIGMFSQMGIKKELIDSFLRKCPIRFTNLDFDENGADELLDDILSTESYSLSEGMLIKILKKKGLYDDSKWHESRGTLLLESNINSVIKRISETVQTFLENVYFNVSLKQRESQMMFEIVLNNNDTLTDEVIDKFLDLQNVGIEDVSAISNKSYSMRLFERRLVAPNWKNVLGMYEIIVKADESVKSTLLPRLPCFVNDNAKSLFNSVFPIEDKVTREFTEYILTCEDISDDICIDLASLVKPKMKGFVPSYSMSIPRILKLADVGVISFTKEIYERVYETGVQNAVCIVKNCIEDYLSIVNEIPFDEEVVRQILCSDKIAWTEKKRLIGAKCGEIAKSDVLKNMIAPNIGISNLDDYPSELVCKCFPLLSPVAVQCEVVLKYNFDKRNTSIALGLMPEPFSQLRKDDERVMLPKSDLVEKLVKKLMSLEIIIAYNSTQFDIEVKTQPKFPL